MESIKKYFLNLLYLIIGFILGISLALIIVYKNEGIFYKELKQENKEIKEMLNEINMEELRAIRDIMKIYVYELRKAFPFGYLGRRKR